MNKFFHDLIWDPRLEFLMLLFWFACIAALGYVNPNESPRLFAGIVAIALSSTALSLLLRRWDQQKRFQKFTEWRAKILALETDAEELLDNPELFDSLDTGEWAEVFLHLEHLSPGQRSLRNALEEIAPEALELCE